MKQAEIKLGGLYVVRLSQKLTIVRVDRLKKSGDKYYACTNLRTGRVISVRSAAKFRKEVPQEQADKWLASQKKE